MKPHEVTYVANRPFQILPPSNYFPSSSLGKKWVDNLFVVSMISRRHRAVVVKVAFVVCILYMMGMLRVGQDTPSKEEEIGEVNAEEIEESGVRPKKDEIPKLEPPNLDLPDGKAAVDDVAQQADPVGDEIEDTKSEEQKEKRRLEEELEKERLKENEELKEREEKEKKRLEEKKEEKAEDKELDLVVAPPKRPEGPGEMGKPYKVRKMVFLAALSA